MKNILKRIIVKIKACYYSFQIVSIEHEIFLLEEELSKGCISRLCYRKHLNLYNLQIRYFIRKKVQLLIE